MNGIAIAFALMNSVALLTLPRRWAPMPLLIGTCYMTMGQDVEIGPFHFTIIRMLIATGVVRIILKGEHLAGGMNAMDRLMALWGAWVLISGFFHEDASSALIFRLGLVYNACGIYFMLRIFCQSLEDVTILCRITAILLIPLSIMMLFEKLTGYNLFSVFGGIMITPDIRAGSVRAQGPFAHAILAGTVGAVCLPLMVGLWRQYRKIAFAGIVACISIVYASTSSGPIMSAVAAIGALFMWHWRKNRKNMRLIRWLAVLGYIGMDLVMNAPAYYILQHIDLTGGSTGWHRARLIESAIEHFSEWWLIGTDYTRHWMPYGVPWSEKHVDITNHYLRMGVDGGLPLMLLFIAILAKGFSYIGQIIQKMHQLRPESRFLVWTFGAMLFAHATTFISVSYFDQSFVFIYLTLAAIASLWSSTLHTIIYNVAHGERSHAVI